MSAYSAFVFCTTFRDPPQPAPTEKLPVKGSLNPIIIHRTMIRADRRPPRVTVPVKNGEKKFALALRGMEFSVSSLQLETSSNTARGKIAGDIAVAAASCSNTQWGGFNFVYQPEPRGEHYTELDGMQIFVWDPQRLLESPPPNTCPECGSQHLWDKGIVSPARLVKGERSAEQFLTSRRWECKSCASSFSDHSGERLQQLSPAQRCMFPFHTTVYYYVFLLRF